MNDKAESILLTRVDNYIATFTLNRPNKFNALSEELLDELQSAFVEAGSDDSIAVIILEARGRAFCAGHHLRPLRSRPAEDDYQTPASYTHFHAYDAEAEIVCRILL